MPIFSKLLVPVDGSAPSDVAIEVALGLAGDQRASVNFLHVVDITKAVGSLPISVHNVAIEAAYDAGHQILESAAAKARERGIPALAEIATGACVECIIDYAHRRGTDLIVIGSHGRGGLPRALLGSVAEGVARRARVPVLVVHGESAERAGHVADREERPAGRHDLPVIQPVGG